MLTCLHVFKDVFTLQRERTGVSNNWTNKRKNWCIKWRM